MYESKPRNVKLEFCTYCNDCMLCDPVIEDDYLRGVMDREQGMRSYYKLVCSHAVACDELAKRIGACKDDFTK